MKPWDVWHYTPHELLLAVEAYQKRWGLDRESSTAPPDVAAFNQAIGLMVPPPLDPKIGPPPGGWMTEELHG